MGTPGASQPETAGFRRGAVREAAERKAASAPATDPREVLLGLGRIVAL
jgi:hypothetical protein